MLPGVYAPPGERRKQCKPTASNKQEPAVIEPEPAAPAEPKAPKERQKRERHVTYDVVVEPVRAWVDSGAIDASKIIDGKRRKR